MIVRSSRSRHPGARLLQQVGGLDLGMRRHEQGLPVGECRYAVARETAPASAASSTHGVRPADKIAAPRRSEQRACAPSALSGRLLHMRLTCSLSDVSLIISTRRRDAGNRDLARAPITLDPGGRGAEVQQRPADLQGDRRADGKRVPAGGEVSRDTARCHCITHPAEEDTCVVLEKRGAIASTASNDCSPPDASSRSRPTCRTRIS